MKIISWNVNGLKAIIKKDFENTINKLNADIICIQETKISKKSEYNILTNYHQYFNFSQKAGYSGVAILSKMQPVNILYGMEVENEYEELENMDTESRVITLEFNNFFVVSVYVPSSQVRKDYRLDFDYNFLKYIEKLHNVKDVIICGDFNICHEKIDVCNRKKHQFLETFSDEERANFDELLNLGLIDTYRYMHPQMKAYSFWTNDIKDRSKSEFGWRLDYILISEYLKQDIRQANILREIEGSDHCPIELILKV